jgi:hypothetical protein
MRNPRWLTALALLALLTLVPQTILACTYCKYSPNNFGFCRESFLYGYYFYNCTESVADPLSGRTRCEYTGVFGECDWRGEEWPGRRAGGGDGSGGGAGNDCWWTDMNGGCILAF